MLGKGLESLIPKKNGQAQNQSASFLNDEQQTTNNQQLKNNSDMKDREDFSVADIAGERPKINEQVVPPIGASGASHNFDTQMRASRKNIQESSKKHQDAIFHIEIEKIKSNPLQPRKEFDQESLKELASSIREFGILQPLVVSKIEEDDEFGTKVEYQLIAGERRLMAAKMLGWERVPVIIRKVENKANHLELAIVENLQRQNLNNIETARAYTQLQEEFGLTQREIATRMGKSRETVANTMKLLDLPSEIQNAVAKGQINESQARLLLTITDQNQQQKLFQELIGKNLSVRALKQKINEKTKDPNSKFQTTNIDLEMLGLQEKLTEILGAKVRIEKGQKEGKIIISFYSPEEIQGIIQKLQTDL